MTTRSLTMSEALDMSVDRLPPLRRTVAKLRLRSEGYRKRTLAELKLKLADDTDCCALLGEGFNAGLHDELIGDHTPFSIDVDKLDQLLAVILKYLPSILEIIFKLFAMVAFLVLCFGLPSSANAQIVCANGQCQLLRGAAVVATAPVRAVANVASRYPSVSSTSGYGSSGSAVASTGYGSSGSTVAAAEPGYGSTGSATYQPRWRFGDRMRANASARQASRASAGYGSSGSSAQQGYGSSGTMLMMQGCGNPACGNPECTCDPCTCAPASVPAPAAPSPVAPAPAAVGMVAPAIALPEDKPNELYAVRAVR